MSDGTSDSTPQDTVPVPAQDPTLTSCEQWKDFTTNYEYPCIVRISKCSTRWRDTNKTALCDKCESLDKIRQLYTHRAPPKRLFGRAGDISVHRRSSSWGGSWLYLQFERHSRWGGPRPYFDIIARAIQGIPNPWAIAGDPPFLEPAGSSTAIITALDWLRTCEKAHAKCKIHSEPSLPTRVLDIGGPDPAVVSLYESQGAKGHYVCLSYCWGVTPFTKTTRANLDSHVAGIQISTMCRTFQDVVQVVRQLGIRYIWIDAMCIIQEDAADWDIEAACMAPYYTNAYLTIAASWAQSATLGLFPPEPTKTRADSIEVFRTARHFPNVVDNREYNPARSDPAAFPMLTRGWCYQERLLSPRVLHFARHEMIWECREQLTCECGQVKYASDYTPKSDFFDGVSNISQKIEMGSEETWRRLVAEYTALSLSYIADRLPALGGLADEMARSYEAKDMPRTYLAGLWVESLIGDMCWQREAGSQCNLRDPPTSSTVSSYRAPSWSWASIEDHVAYTDKISSGWFCHEPGYRKIEYATVLNAHCTPAGASKTGRVTDGFVELECFLVPAVLHELEDDPDYAGRYLAFEPVQTAYMNLQWYSDGRAWVEPKVEGKYSVLPLVTIDTGSYETFHGILVQRQDGLAVQDGDEMPVMIRVGFVTKRYERWSKTMKDLSRRKVRLV